MAAIIAQGSQIALKRQTPQHQEPELRKIQGGLATINKLAAREELHTSGALSAQKTLHVSSNQAAYLKAQAIVGENTAHVCGIGLSPKAAARHSTSLAAMAKAAGLAA